MWIIDPEPRESRSGAAFPTAELGRTVALRMDAFYLHFVFACHVHGSIPPKLSLKKRASHWIREEDAYKVVRKWCANAIAFTHGREIRD
jgi:hypothetical protein